MHRSSSRGGVPRSSSSDEPAVIPGFTSHLPPLTKLHLNKAFMEAVLNYKPEDLEDYYGLLGCDELSSTEQILNEYKIRALACHPDKHLDNPRAVTEFQKLQEAKEVLCDDAKRKNYDLWKRSGVTIPFQDWQAMNDSVKTSMHWAVRNKKEPMLEASKPEEPCQDEEQRDDEDVASSSFYCHQRFRWAADSPSSLLRKFRNYEI